MSSVDKDSAVFERTSAFSPEGPWTGPGRRGRREETEWMCEEGRRVCAGALCLRRARGRQGQGASGRKRGRTMWSRKASCRRRRHGKWALRVDQAEKEGGGIPAEGRHAGSWTPVSYWLGERLAC